MIRSLGKITSFTGEWIDSCGVELVITRPSYKAPLVFVSFAWIASPSTLSHNLKQLEALNDPILLDFPES